MRGRIRGKEEKEEREKGIKIEARIERRVNEKERKKAREKKKIIIIISSEPVQLGSKVVR